MNQFSRKSLKSLRVWRICLQKLMTHQHKVRNKLKIYSPFHLCTEVLKLFPMRGLPEMLLSGIKVCILSGFGVIIHKIMNLHELLKNMLKVRNKNTVKSCQLIVCSETPFWKNLYHIETNQLIWFALQLISLVSVSKDVRQLAVSYEFLLFIRVFQSWVDNENIRTTSNEFILIFLLLAMN